MLAAEIIKKYRGKSLAYLTDKAQDAVNKFVRKRDSVNGYFICISCEKLKPIRHCQAGHFYSRGNYNSVRFNLDNINAECDYCNGFNHDHLIGYQKNLIKKIGEKRFNDLEKLAQLKNFKYSREFLINIIEKYKNI